MLCMVFAVSLFAPGDNVVAVAGSDHGVMSATLSPGGDETPVPAAVLASHNEDIGLCAGDCHMLDVPMATDSSGSKAGISASRDRGTASILLKTSKTVTGLHDEPGGVIIGRLSQGYHPVGALFVDSGGGKRSFLYADATIKDSYTAYAPRQSI